jgi:hypothetical protein
VAKKSHGKWCRKGVVAGGQDKKKQKTYRKNKEEVRIAILPTSDLLDPEEGLLHHVALSH